MSEERKVDVRPLKRLALGLPKEHPLRAGLGVEDDVLPAEAFLSKVPVWLRLLQSVG